MLKLTRHLYAWQPDGALFDYYERAHLNHVMAAQDPKTAGFTYMTPLMSGAERGYSTPADDAFWCCVGTGMESHSKHGDSIFWQGADGGFIVNSLHSRGRDLADAGRTRHAGHALSVRADLATDRHEGTQRPLPGRATRPRLGGGSCGGDGQRRSGRTPVRPRLCDRRPALAGGRYGRDHAAARSQDRSGTGRSDDRLGAARADGDGGPIWARRRIRGVRPTPHWSGPICWRRSARCRDPTRAMRRTASYAPATATSCPSTASTNAAARPISRRFRRHSGAPRKPPIPPNRRG